VQFSMSRRKVGRRYPAAPRFEKGQRPPNVCQAWNFWGNVGARHASPLIAIFPRCT
jgi:hypothetical protein